MSIADTNNHKRTNNIYLIGYMGVGKSTVGALLAQHLQYQYIDLDAVIQAQEGRSITAIFETKGEAYFRQLECKALHNTATLSHAVIACGGGTPCYHNNMDWMLAYGISIWLKASIHTIMKRMQASELQQRPLLQGYTAAALQQHVTATLLTRNLIYSRAHYTVIVDDMLASQVVLSIATIISDSK